MPLYHYRCDCGVDFEIVESIKSDPQTLCPECHQETLYRVIHGGIGAFVDPGITTIGKLGEVNSKKMGKYKVEELERDRPKKDTKVAYTDKEKRQQINKMTPKQKLKYIYEG